MFIAKNQLDTYAIIQQSLQNIHPFSEEQIKLFQEHTTVKFLPKNTLLLKPGEVCDFVAILLEGSLRLFHPEGESEHTLAFYTETDFVGDHDSFTQQQPSKNSIAALEATVVATININKIHLLISLDTAFLVLARIIGEWSIPSQLWVNSPSPIKRFELLMKTHPGWVVRFPQKYLASYLGMAPETFSRMKRKSLFS